MTRLDHSMTDLRLTPNDTSISFAHEQVGDMGLYVQIEDLRTRLSIVELRLWRVEDELMRMKMRRSWWRRAWNWIEGLFG